MPWYWLWAVFFAIWIILLLTHVPVFIADIFLGLWVAMIIVILFRNLVRRGLD